MQDFSAYSGTLPYASELFGVYQPLMGWKSRLTSNRFVKNRAAALDDLAQRLLTRARASVEVDARSRLLRVVDLKPLDLTAARSPQVSALIDSGVARLLSRDIGDVAPEDWKSIITTDSMTSYLDRVQRILTDAQSEGSELTKYPELAQYRDSFQAQYEGVSNAQSLATAFFDKESRIAGYLTFIAQHEPDMLTRLFFDTTHASADHALMAADPLLSFGSETYDAVISPIGIMNLYRQYFFEFDSFLGPSVGHVWLSPGATVELVEVSTRRSFAERTAEAMTETMQRSETQTTNQDDIADAVKQENSNNAKFGITNTASYRTPVFQDTATASFSLDTAKSSARETAHKQMRQQSEKLSSEIKRNFKTSFKTSTEVTDTKSSRYVIQNNTDRLVNYELRRKMRKIGVQVQDIGSQLCWHTFVDDPGAPLGVSQLIHIGEPPNMSDLQHPVQPVQPVGESQDVTLNIPFVGIDTSDKDIAYTNGGETEVGVVDSKEHIESNFPQSVNYTKPGYTLKAVTLDSQGADVKATAQDMVSEEGSSAGTFTVHLDYIHFHDRESVALKAILAWAPDETTVTLAQEAYEKEVTEYTAERARRYKEAFIAASRDRVAAASAVVTRPSEDLREEERTVIYRKLISQLMSVGDSGSKHVTSELIRSIFDVDKMLYFVAPEWWVPRLHRSTQVLGNNTTPAGGGGRAPKFEGRAVNFGPVGAGSAVKPSSLITYSPNARKVLDEGTIERLKEADRPGRSPIPAENLVDWGGRSAIGRDNYYISEDSKPARLGSSLGWLLQLDGDNLRNALLNSPWVKAVIPIRIGKELEAMAWLRQAHVEGEDGLASKYRAAPSDPPELQSTDDHEVSVEEAIRYLIGQVRKYDHKARTAVADNPSNPDDPMNHFIGSLPGEAVFEHGFYPLSGGVRYDQDGTDQAMISQWMEVLPTDQVAALEVEYDPKTLAVKIAPQPPRTVPKHDHDQGDK